MFPEDEPSQARLRVKICGITNAADAAAAVAAGADAIGLNCYPGSRRYMELATAGEWLELIPPEVLRVAVVVNPTWEEAISIARLPYVDALQLHGSEPQAFCRRLAGEGVRFAKALPVLDAPSLESAASYSTHTLVLDSPSSGSMGFGGSGHTFPWELAQHFTSAHPDLRVILAGGLTPENVGRAVRQVRPFCVDVTSGVEMAAGRKDHARIRAFIEAARAA